MERAPLTRQPGSQPQIPASGRVSLALLAGFAAAAAFPPWGIAWLAWLAIAPLLVAARATSPGRAALLGLGTGCLANGLALHWLLVSGVTPPAFGLLILFSGAKYALFAAAAALVYRRRAAWAGLVLPAVWVVLEYTGVQIGWLSMPWGFLGHTQYEVGPMVRVASVAGVYGVSFVLLVVSVAIAEFACRPLTPTGVRRVGTLTLAAPAALAALLVLWGNLSVLTTPSRAEAEREASLRVAVVQGGFYDVRKEDRRERAAVFERYIRLTREAALEELDLVVWPEAAVPGVLPHNTGALGLLGRLAHEIDTPLLVAAGGRDKRAPASQAEQAANSAFLIGPDEKIQARYDKVRLLPFNEYLPLRGRFSWPEWIASPSLRDATPGRDPSIFETGGFRYSVQICWESLFAEDARHTVHEGVDFLVTLTNESFTSEWAGHENLFSVNVFRAVEQGRPLVRATTTSISAVVDADGRILDRMWNDDGGEPHGVLIADIPRAKRSTYYARMGDWIVLVSAGLAIAPLAVRRSPDSGLSR